MRPMEPSGTAWNAALHRAAHQLLDGGTIFSDPLAVPIVGAEGAATASRMGHLPEMRRWRAFMGARAHFAESCLRAAVERRGVSQLVVLGAGLDTFAYRNPLEERLKVFEVDHPATQRWKRERLRAANITIPDSVRYASADLEDADLIRQLEASGFARGEPAFFICLGLFYYLSPTTIRAILATVAELSAEVVFDYSDPPATLSAFEQRTLARIQENLAKKGESYVSYFDPSDLHATLRALGLAEIEDLATEDWLGRYGGAEMLEAWRAVTVDPNRGAHILFARSRA